MLRSSWVSRGIDASGSFIYYLNERRVRERSKNSYLLESSIVFDSKTTDIVYWLVQFIVWEEKN